MALVSKKCTGILSLIPLGGEVGSHVSRNTRQAGTNVGQELDLLVNFTLTKHQNVVLGYSHLFAGDFIKQTGNGRDVDFVYAQWGFRW